jgi:hypothetical protein|tara:strand:- start:1167 stop:1421 length:255 start_codon:yes stop_codon:yes gene_type:complete
MRTKTLIEGFKNSQKIRVIVDGVGIYTTVGATASIFATSKHYAAVNLALQRLAFFRRAALHEGNPIPLGLSCTCLKTNVQADLL